MGSEEEERAFGVGDAEIAHTLVLEHLTGEGVVFVEDVVEVVRPKDMPHYLECLHHLLVVLGEQRAGVASDDDDLLVLRDKRGEGELEVLVDVTTPENGHKGGDEIELADAAPASERHDGVEGSLEGVEREDPSWIGDIVAGAEKGRQE